MAVSETAAETITSPLLAEERSCTGEVRGGEKQNEDAPPITCVLLLSLFIVVCGSLNFGLAGKGISDTVRVSLTDALAVHGANLVGGIVTMLMLIEMKVGVSHYFGSLVNISRDGVLIGHNLFVSRDKGMVGYSSPVQSEIMDDLGLSTAEYSLFGTLLTVGGAFGAIACGKMSDYIGRRGTFGVTDVFSIGGWLAILVSQGALSLYLGRLLLGFALGLSCYVIPVYVSEITHKNLRGRFVILHMFMICGGISIAFTLGVFISWRILASIGFIPNISQLIGLFFIPESPRWLMKVDRENEFEAALQHLRGADADISEESTDIKDYTQAFERASKASIFELFQRKYAYALTVGIGLSALSQLDGLNGIIYYASSIFVSAGLSSKLGSITMAIVKMPSILIALLLADKCGRRPLLMVSAGGICLACTLAGISFLLQDHDWLQGFSPYLALLGLLMYAAFYSIGMAGIPILIISEVYPINIKGLAGSVATLVSWVASGLVTYVFNFLMEWSSAGTFFILAGICGFTLLFVVKVVPETKGRTLEEIQASVNRMFHGDVDQA